MTQQDPKLAAIDGFFAAHASNDRDGIAAVLADEIEWTIPGHHPLSGDALHAWIVDPGKNVIGIDERK